MSDQAIREALNQHWTASDTGDFATEHDIYHEDAVLDYPQSRERILGRHNMQLTRGVEVVHETQYFAAPFEAGESRRKWVVNMDSPASRSSVSSAESP